LLPIEEVRPLPVPPTLAPLPLPAPLHGPVARFLSDPSAWLHGVEHGLLHAAASAARLAPAVGVAAVALTILALLARRVIRAQGGDGAFVELLVPAEVDPAGAVAFWRRVHAVAARRRRGRGSVSFELAGSPAGVRIGIWAPPGTSPQAVSAAAGASWPGTVTVVGPAPEALGTGRVAGGSLRLAGAEWLALSADGEPLRGMLGALAECGAGESGVVQVWARPARHRRLARARRGVLAARAGRSTSGLGRLLDLVDSRNAPKASGAIDPVRAAEVRAGVAKLADAPAWEVLVRYGVAGPGASRSERVRLRARAWALADSFGVYGGANHFRPVRLRGAARVLAERRAGRGQLMGNTELAALAHLPAERIAGLAEAGAAAVSPPPGAFGDGDDDRF
jgi:hypothetical protein